MNSTVPVEVNGLSNVIAIAANKSNSYALKNDGTVWSWGAMRTAPVQMKELSGVSALVAAGESAFALKSDGTVWSWGDNSKKQLGDGTTNSRTVAQPINGLNGITQIAVSKVHGMALKSDGTVWKWGEAGSLTPAIPVQNTKINNVRAIGAADNKSLAVKKDGTVWVWDYYYAPEYPGTSVRYTDTPISIGGLTGVEIIAASSAMQIAAKDGSIWDGA
ncbi:hypothetical protein JCM16418_5168 [Paenibacillus pini JCM 16418]|uniref:BNR repeat domain protein n=1 Tax=Paenibacillus pini JCM 16418 TaxID=1236976 RepID=W7YUM6_9BACL|nr:hypothetical protein JCM16418_5168 [Paenibacillus pini JCM 16418]